MHLHGLFIHIFLIGLYTHSIVVTTRLMFNDDGIFAETRFPN